MKKEIFAALEIADQEIRIVVGEFYNSRFNVIAVEKYRTINKVGNKIIDEVKLSNDVKAAVLNTSKTIKAPISAVLLLMPSENMKRIPLIVNAECKDGIVTKKSIRDAFDKARKVNCEDNYLPVNTICNKYRIGGEVYHRAPIGKRANNVVCNIDLLCVKKNLAFTYAKIIENANLRVIDIVLDVYGIASEASLFDKSIDQNIIVLQMNANNCRLALVSDSKIMATDVISVGMNKFINAISDEFDISYDVAKKLLLFNGKLSEENLSDDPVHVWEVRTVTHSVSEKDIEELIKPMFYEFANEILKAGKAIMDSRETKLFVTGLGAELVDFDVYLSKFIGIEVSNYIPQTLGARNPQLAGILGAFYIYKDKSRVLEESDVSVDVDIFNENLVESKKDKQNLSMTSRLKKIILNSEEEGE